MSVSSIFPDIRAIAAVRAESDIIDVRRTSGLHEENQLMLGAV
jgi:hypothetical protein